MNLDELLPQLQDILPPEEPAWWLLSYAQVALIVSLAAVVTLIWIAFRHRQNIRLIDLAAKELDALRVIYHRDRDPNRLAQGLSRWMKRIALKAFPDRQLESVCGDRWLLFLDESVGDCRFSSGEGRVFGNAIYAPYPDLDGDLLLELCDQWLHHIKPRLYKPGTA